MAFELYSATFPKERTNVLSEHKRLFFVLGGHLTNEITMLNKLLVYSMSSRPESAEAGECWSTQNLLLLKMLAGKLWEAWRRTRTHYYGTQLSREVAADLPDDASDAVAEIRRYFSRPNAINTVRNGFAFHYPAEEVLAVLDTIPDDFTMKVYLAKNYGNSCFYFAEEPVFRNMTERIGHGNAAEAFNVLTNDVQVYARHFMIFYAGFFSLILGEMCGEDIDLTRIDIPICDAPALEDISIPPLFDADQEQ